MGITSKRGRSSVTFQSLSTTQSSSGEYVKIWSTHASRRCTFAPDGVSEITDTATQRRLTTATISVRYVDGLSTEMRAVIDSRTFEIESVIAVDGLKREQLVEIREIV